MTLFVLFVTTFLVSCTEPTLSEYVETFNSECPEDMGDGVVITSAELNQNCLQINMLDQEDILGVDDPEMRQMLPAIAQGMKETFLSNRDMRDVFEKCVEEGYGFRIVLKGSQSKKGVPILEVTKDELKYALLRYK